MVQCLYLMYRYLIWGYIIQAKRDFGEHGFFTNGLKIKKGYVVTDGNVNVMPGATWFKSVIEARVAIDVFIEVEHDADSFWERLRDLQGLSQYQEV